MNRFITANADLCIGCRTCEIACVAAHPCDSVDVFVPQSFHPRLKVIKSGDDTAPVMCRHCDGAPCLQVCVHGAMAFEGETVQVRYDLCTGCGACAMVCPFGVVEMVMLSGALQAVKCDLCVTRSAGPACVEHCPTKALSVSTPDEIKGMQETKRLKAISSAFLTAQVKVA